jgi:hypothetical protein
MSTSFAQSEAQVPRQSRSIFDRLDDLQPRMRAMDRDGFAVDALRETDAVRTGGLQTLEEFEALLPHLVDREVSARFRQMTEALHREFEETHIRAIETFVKNIQGKLLHRISVLETDINRQAQAMHELREYSQRTEDNLIRLIHGVEKLAQQMPAKTQLIARDGKKTSAHRPGGI